MEKRFQDFGQEGFSLVELLMVIALFAILSAIAVVSLNSSRRAANGASAINSLRVFSKAEATYAMGVGNRRYGEAQDLFYEDLIDEGLGRACNPLVTGLSKGGARALPAQPKSGFVFFINVVPPTDNEPAKYTILGRPIYDTGLTRTGDHTFFMDQTGVIRASDSSTEQATVTSRPIG
jgi:type IV pilus assembly protein PilA